jgi:hypothetical protein
LALGVSPGCIVIRTYNGNEVTPPHDGEFVVGKTTKTEVLAQRGAPDRLVRQYDGDVFVYEHHRANVGTLVIEEPVITHLTILEYTKSQDKADRLVVFFDRAGHFMGAGYRRGTDELSNF